MITIDVINLRTWKPTDSQPGHTYIYCGRRMPDRPGSALANPFKLVSEELRVACLRKYDEWLDEQSPASPARRELRRLIDLAKRGPLALGCWCTPAPCHADLIRARILFAIAWERADEDGRYALDERASILQYEAGFMRGEAERRAVEAVGKSDS